MKVNEGTVIPVEYHIDWKYVQHKIFTAKLIKSIVIVINKIRGEIFF